MASMRIVHILNSSTLLIDAYFSYIYFIIIYNFLLLRSFFNIKLTLINVVIIKIYR